MIEETTHPGWLARRLPWYAAIAGFIIFTPLAFLHPDAYFFLTIFVIAPALTLISVVVILWLIYDATAYGQQQLQPILGSLAILWILPISLLFYDSAHPFELRETARWFSSSQGYKNAVLAQPPSTNGELKHIEWDASGFAGVANNRVYLAFDPSDTLSSAAKGRELRKFNGLPCKVRHIRRLESHWYAILFYTDQYWSQDGCS